MDINLFKTDPTLANEGVWLHLDENSAIKIGYGAGAAFNAASVKVGKRYPAALRRNADQLTQMTIEVMAECVVLDWRGLEENGVPLPCTRENKIKILQIETLRDIIATFSRDVTNFQNEALAEDAAAVKSGD